MKALTEEKVQELLSNVYAAISNRRPLVGKERLEVVLEGVMNDVRPHDPQRAALIEDARLAYFAGDIDLSLSYIEKARQPLISVRFFTGGQGHERVLVNGQAITNWHGFLPRDLFYYLLLNAPVSRIQIFRTFWPALSKSEATNVFHVTKRKITERLSSLLPTGHPSLPLTEYVNRHYYLTEALRFDIDLWRVRAIYSRHIELGDVTDEDLTSALKLMEGRFLPSITEAWVGQFREEVSAIKVSFLIAASRRAEGRERYDLSEAYLKKVLEIDPLREDVARDLISTYVRMDNRNEAWRVYHELVHRLHEKLGIEPSKETRQLVMLLLPE